MRISEQPTNHILVWAHCRSEWDNCDFAIIDCGAGWRERLQKRMAAARLHTDDQALLSLRYSDYDAGFYVSSEDDIDALLSETGCDRAWAFIELEEGEEDKFQTPESRLDCHMMNLYTDGTGAYTAYGKHTGEEYYTESLPFVDILENMNTTN